MQFLFPSETQASADARGDDESCVTSKNKVLQLCRPFLPIYSIGKLLVQRSNDREDNRVVSIHIVGMERSNPSATIKLPSLGGELDLSPCLSGERRLPRGVSSY